VSREIRRIPYEEFFRNLASIFEQVIQEHETVVVETKEGEAVVLRVAEVGLLEGKSEEDYEAFLSSAGGWADVDVDQFLKDNYESRRMNTRPTVEI
jgi:PHD/YefM family antitoxin component YafN of YafNO toxin-antitoxin module